MKFFSLIVLAFLLFLSSTGFAQPSKMLNNRDNYNIMFGASWSVLDDDGNGTNPFAFDQWHTMLYPTRAFFDKYIYSGWSAEIAGSYQKYNPAKLVNDSLNISGSLFALDAHIKYSPYQFLGRGWFEPYASAGFGFTNRTSDPRNTAKPFCPTLNLSVGMNFWLGNNFGIQLQSSAKFGTLDFFKTSNYMQHSAGFVIRLDKPSDAKSDFNKSKYKIKKSHTKIKIKKGKKSKET